MTSDPNNRNPVIDDNRIITKMIKNDLRKIKSISSQGYTLYQDKVTNVFWEKYYPYPESHGDGPPALRLVSAEYAKEHYGIECL